MSAPPIFAKENRGKRYAACPDVVPVAGLEPARIAPRDFESRAFANFATPANFQKLDAKTADKTADQLLGSVLKKRKPAEYLHLQPIGQTKRIGF